MLMLWNVECLLGSSGSDVSNICDLVLSLLSAKQTESVSSVLFMAIHAAHLGFASHECD